MVYLLYMAWQCLKAGGVLRLSEGRDAGSDFKVVVRGILFNLLNPKLSIFFVAFLPQFISPSDAEPLLAMAGLSAIFTLMTLVVFCGYGVFAAVLRVRVVGNPAAVKWLQRCFAASFGLLAVRLAVAER